MCVSSIAQIFVYTISTKERERKKNYERIKRNDANNGKWKRNTEAARVISVLSAAKSLRNILHIHTLPGVGENDDAFGSNAQTKLRAHSRSWIVCDSWWAKDVHTTLTHSLTSVSVLCITHSARETCALECYYLGFYVTYNGFGHLIKWHADSVAWIALSFYTTLCVSLLSCHLFHLSSEPYISRNLDSLCCFVALNVRCYCGNHINIERIYPNRENIYMCIIFGTHNAHTASAMCMALSFRWCVFTRDG